MLKFVKKLSKICLFEFFCYRKIDWELKDFKKVKRKKK